MEFLMFPNLDVANKKYNYYVEHREKNDWRQGDPLPEVWTDSFCCKLVRKLQADYRTASIIDPGSALVELEKTKKITVQFKVPDLNFSLWFTQFASKGYKNYQRDDQPKVLEWNNRHFNNPQSTPSKWVKLLTTLFLIFGAVTTYYLHR